MKRYDELIAQCDTDIRAGRPREVAKRLEKLNLARVPRVWRLPLAKICRRAGLHSLGLTLLSRTIHGNKTASGASATDAEFAEYGMLLLRSGAVREAQSFLARVDPTKAPDALLYQAYIHFIRWEFEQSVPLLEAYVKTDLPPYPLLVGKINLAYALVETHQHDRAIALLHEVVETSQRDGYSVLERNSRCYLAQTYILKNDFSKAQNEIALATAQMPSARNNDELVALKFHLILDALQSKSSGPLDQLRELAIRNRDAVAHREADFYALKIRFDLERFLYLYFGTPFDAFRDRMRTELNFEPNREVYVLGTKDAPRFDLATGLLDEEPILNPGHKCHQLIDALLRDFYQPMRMASLFSSLFPDEHYMPESSPDRMHQHLRRTRRWIEEKNLPLVIEESDGFYSLKVDGYISFRIPLHRQDIHHYQLQLDVLKRTAAAHTGHFSAKDARDRLGLPKTSAFRLITWALEHGQIVRVGEKTNDVLYRFTDHLEIKKAA